MAAHPPEKGFWFLTGYVLLPRWDYAILERALRDLAAHTEAETWADTAVKLSRYGRWEYEEYTDPRSRKLGSDLTRARPWWSRLAGRANARPQSDPEGRAAMLGRARSAAPLNGDRAKVGASP
jgi:hypothetical protein